MYTAAKAPFFNVKKNRISEVDHKAANMWASTDEV